MMQIINIKIFNISNALAFEMNKREYSSISKKENIRIQEIIDSIKNTENFKIAFKHKLENPLQLYTFTYLAQLGDALLDVYALKVINKALSGSKKGVISNAKVILVSGKNLAKLLIKNDLIKYAELIDTFKDKSEKNKNKYLADIFEAFIATLYIEKGEETLKEFLFLTLLDLQEIKEILNVNKKNLVEDFKDIDLNLLNIKDLPSLDKNKIKLIESYAKRDIKLGTDSQINHNDDLIENLNHNKVMALIEQILKNQNINDQNREYLKDILNHHFSDGSKDINKIFKNSEDLSKSLNQLNKIIEKNDNLKFERVQIIFQSFFILSRSLIISAIIIGISLIISKFI